MAFQHLGYYLEYHSNGKYIGTLNIEDSDREEIGYAGKRNHIATEKIELSNRRKIKKGAEYHTYMYPLCGKII